MGRHRKLKEAALACGFALSLALQVTSASAFSTEPVAPPAANLQAVPTPQSGQAAIPQLNLADPLALTKPNGTDLTIPGFGTVATLPKLDFGLELLYGPKNGPEALQLDQHAPEGDVQIKGTLSHKF
jgi:hypothetical protein